MKPVVLALMLAGLAGPAVADVPPPAEIAPASAETTIDTTAASTAASLFAPGTSWTLAVSSDGDDFKGDLAIRPGNRFTLRVGNASKPGRTQDGIGVWGIVDAKPGGLFTIVFVMLEVKKNGEYDADEALAFRFTMESEGVLKGVLVDGEDKAPATLTRR